MKKILILFVLALFLLPQGVLADIPSIADVGVKSILSCFEISNINAYPDYTFKVHIEHYGSNVENITEGDCIPLPSGYSHGAPLSAEYITALNKSDSAGKNVSFEILRNYLGYPYGGRVDVYDPREKATVVMEIISITNDKLELKKSKVIYTYTDGTSEEKLYQSQDVVPEPSRKALFTWWIIWFVFLPLAAVIIAIILLKRRPKSRKGKSKK